MSEIIPIAPISIDDIIDAPVNIKRMIAEAFKNQGMKRVFYSPDRQEHTYMEILAIMVWDAVTEGIIHFADDTELKINDDAKAWTDVLKFLANHVDGPVGTGGNIGQVNVFKVYQGIDPDRL